MKDDGQYILYDDKMTIRDYYNLIALCWRIPIALAGSAVLYLLIKLDGEK